MLLPKTLSHLIFIIEVTKQIPTHTEQRKNEEQQDYKTFPET